MCSNSCRAFFFQYGLLDVNHAKNTQKNKKSYKNYEFKVPHDQLKITLVREFQPIIY